MIKNAKLTSDNEISSENRFKTRWAVLPGEAAQLVERKLSLRSAKPTISLKEDL